MVGRDWRHLYIPSPDRHSQVWLHRFARIAADLSGSIPSRSLGSTQPRPPWRTALDGKHRRRSPARPYAVAALLAVALATAGGGAALADRYLTRTGGTAATGDDRADGDRASRAESSPGAAGTPAEPSPATATSAPAAPSTAPASPTQAPIRSTAPSPTRSISSVERLENEVTALVNTERAKAGCPAVHTDERLRTAARGHSVDMATYGYFSHTGRDGSSPWDRARRAGYDQAIGENIAYGYRTPAEVMRGWMNSDGHRANILNCAARAIGNGLAYRADGTPYWTQMFGSV